MMMVYVNDLFHLLHKVKAEYLFNQIKFVPVVKKAF
jgi:hypothetical protein